MTTPPRPIRIAYFCTTFPVATETFIQREVRALADPACGAELRIESFWGGEARFEGLRVRRFGWRDWLALAPALAWAVARHPAALDELLREFLSASPPGTLNVLENLFGLAAGIVRAKEIAAAPASARPDWIHAVWASLPATAAWVASRLTGVPWSMGAHAYDVFEGGGDWVLVSKLRAAAFVHTTSESTAARLRERGCAPGKIALIRRGVDLAPRAREPRTRRRPLRILAVGRMVEKMGYGLQVEVYRALRVGACAFEARIIGDGPQRGPIERALERAGMAEAVRVEGRQPFDAVCAALEWADALLFTGVVARDGDRAGVPNIIAEAMATGTPVVATPVGGVAEVIAHGDTGLLGADAAELAAALRVLAEDDARWRALSVRGAARATALFDPRRNADALLARMRSAHAATFFQVRT